MRRRYRGVIAYFGLPGSGKTYELARWGLRQMEAGRDVWCSAGFELAGARTFHSIDEFLAIPSGAAICWDEAPLWLDARAWSKMDPRVLYELTQVRKGGTELRYSCIHPSMVETTLRRVTFEWWEVRPLAGGLFPRWNKLRRARSPEGAPRIHVEHGPWKWACMSPRVWAAFDTSARADVSSWASARVPGN